MEVTVLGKLILVIPVQFSNACEPIIVSAPSLVPKSILVNPVHPLNAWEPMEEYKGPVVDPNPVPATIKEVQPAKAAEPTLKIVFSPRIASVL